MKEKKETEQNYLEGQDADLAELYRRSRCRSSRMREKVKMQI